MAKKKSPKIGMIFECGPDGADQQVCEHLARRINALVEVSSVTLDNKPNLIESCGPDAAQLLDDGCERVLIVWDLFPAWRERTLKPCRHEDREGIFHSLDAAGLSRDNVHLICIREEWEAWLIADGRAVSGGRTWTADTSGKSSSSCPTWHGSENCRRSADSASGYLRQYDRMCGRIATQFRRRSDLPTSSDVGKPRMCAPDPETGRGTASPDV